MLWSNLFVSYMIIKRILLTMFVKALNIDAWSKHTSREIAYNNILKYLHHMVMVGTKMGMTALVSSGTPQSNLNPTRY